MPTPETIAEAFRELDFHDNTFVDMRVWPSQLRGEGVQSVVEIQLLQRAENQLRTIRFSGCTNLRVAMDFDILAGNLPPNTSGVDAYTNPNRMRELMRSQQKDWGVQYAPSVASPLGKKLEAMDLVAFRVQFCGGAVEVIAREYRVENPVQR